MTENQNPEIKKSVFPKSSKFSSEEERVRVLAGADVPRYPDGRPVLFLNQTTPLSFEEYKRMLKAQKRMASMGRVHMMQWPKNKGKSEKRFVFGKSGGE